MGQKFTNTHVVYILGEGRLTYKSRRVLQGSTWIVLCFFHLGAQNLISR